VVHANAVQQRDQARPGLVFDAAFSRNPRTDRAGRAWQGCGDPGFQLVLLLHRQPAAAPFMAEARQTFDSVFLIKLVPGPNRVVVEQQHPCLRRGRLSAIDWQLMPLSNNTSALARRANRCAAEPSRANSIRSLRDSLSRKPGRIMDEAESPQGRLARGFFRNSEESGYITTWQKVEREVCGVFVKVSTCRDEKVASAIFYSPQDKLQNARRGG
jgi:hypothetical protein